MPQIVEVMKHCIIYLKVTMTIALLIFPLLAMGEDPIKVFDLNIDNVYNLYIDNPGLADEEIIFCFQTTNQLIKTNAKGQVVETIINPYQYFSVYEGDTLILKGHSVINEEGNIVVDYPEINGSYEYITVSSSGIYVFQKVYSNRPVNTASSVQNFRTRTKVFSAQDIMGLCYSGSTLYGIGKQSSGSYPSILTWVVDEKNNKYYQRPLTIKEPRGIAENSDYLYIYSDADKALYKLESPLPQNQDLTPRSADSLCLGSDTVFIYERNRNYSDLLSAEISKDNIDSVVLYSLTTDLHIQKSNKASKRDVESLVKHYLPDARISWDSGEYDYRCNVTTSSLGLDDAVDSLIKEDAIALISKRYIRKDWKDILDLYPFAGEIYAYGITNQIYITYIDDNTRKTADELINSMGLDITTIDSTRTDKHKSAYLRCPKSIDVASAANRLYESGLFLYAGPLLIGGGLKKCQVDSIDHTNIPYYYRRQDGAKAYLYMVPGRFVVRKDSGKEMAQMTSIIKSYCGNYSRIFWLDEEHCMVKTYTETAKTAMEALKKIDDVKWVSEQYLDNDLYAHSLKYGQEMTYWGLDGRLTVVFNEEISDVVKDNIISDYSLSYVSSYTKRGIIYWTYEIPKETDVLSVCRSIYETGNVQFVEPYIVKEGNGGLHPSSIISIPETTTTAKEIGTQYYNLSGQRINTPSGLTIVVTRYSDGTVRSEKGLFR